AFPKSVPNWVFFISVHSCSLVVNRVLVAAQPALRCIAGFQPARRFAGSKAPELGTLCRLEIGPNCPRNGGLSNHLSSLESDVLKTPARERRRGALPLSQKASRSDFDKNAKRNRGFVADLLLKCHPGWSLPGEFYHVAE